MGDFSNAIPTFTRALAVTNVSGARLDRAYAYARSGRLDAAEADYKEVLRAFPNDHRAYYGLGELAWHNKDTNAAIRYFQECLSKASPSTKEYEFAAGRLKSLQQEGPKTPP